MTSKQMFVSSLIILAVSGLGFLGSCILGFAYFTHQGNDMDWIYTAGGVFVLTGLASGFTAIVSGLITIRDRSET